jgi:hypothetical protein
MFGGTSKRRKFMATEFDYDDFVYKFNQGESWCNVGNGGYTHAGAKLTLWQNYQGSILDSLPLKC